MGMLGKAIHSLAKIGDEVYLEPGGDGLALRAVNSSRSAYATFNFANSFFSSVDRGSGDDVGEEGRCKVMVRSLLLAFRSLAVLEKTVESCSIETGAGQSKLVVGLNCRHSVAKQFSMALVECDTLRAVYDLDSCCNTWTIQAKVLQEANGNFLATQEEVSMQVGPDFFRLKNYSEEYDEKKQVHTELSMHPGEFETFSIGLETTVTFCLKELRSLIAFAEFLQLPITATFTSGGQPLVLTVSQPSPTQPVSCVFVLATLAEHSSVETAVSRVATTPAAKQRPSNNANLLPPKQMAVDPAAPPGRANSTQLPDESVCVGPPPPGSPDLSTIAGPEMVQGTPPPAKKKRHMLFRRCFEATFNPSLMPGVDKVLAPDSDEEK